MNSAIRVFLFLAGSVVCAIAAADPASCDLIRAAYVKTGSAGGKMTLTGHDFAKDTPRIYGTGTHNCEHLRDETIDGQVAGVYREQYRASTGSTDAMLWISKASGRLNREEQDADIVGKGKGHISYRWPAAKP